MKKASINTVAASTSLKVKNKAIRRRFLPMLEVTVRHGNALKPHEILATQRCWSMDQCRDFALSLIHAMDKSHPFYGYWTTKKAQFRFLLKGRQMSTNKSAKRIKRLQEQVSKRSSMQRPIQHGKKAGDCLPR